MAKPTLTYELKKLLNGITDKLVLDFPIEVITPNYLVLSILENNFCVGYDVLTSLMMDDTINKFKEFINNKILSDTTKSIKQLNTDSKFSKEYDDIVDDLYKQGINPIDSGNMLYSIVSNNNDIIKFLKKNGVTLEQMKNVVDDKIKYDTKFTNNDDNSKPKKKTKKKKEKVESTDIIPVQNNDAEIEPTEKPKKVLKKESNIVEDTCLNLVREASNGTYNNIYGFDEQIDRAFNILAKCDRKCVAIVGPIGSGKTSLVRKMALMMYNDECPEMFKNMYIVESKTAFNDTVVNYIANVGKYIPFIDNCENLFSNKDLESINSASLKEMITTPNVSTILAMTDTAYAKYIESKPDLARCIQKISIGNYDDETLFRMVRNSASKYEDDKSVFFSDEIIESSIRLSKQYIQNESNPSAALNVLDSASTYVRLHANFPPEMYELRNMYYKIVNEKNSIPSTGNAEDFDRKDELIRLEMKLKNELIKLGAAFITTPIILTLDDLRLAVSNIINVPLNSVDQDEKSKLKEISTNIKKFVIGQDETVDDVCRAIKRQRVGLSNPNKPVVMLFVGSTGTGKTYLAKRVAYEMFGNENEIVKLDMSEYSDKTSVTKLYGSSSGYVGYEDGGILTESIKKKNRCVLLLDEIEKAHEDVYNVFLQVFDEGRMTDNKGNVVNFKNVIIIMTSNVGAMNVAQKTAKIGFGDKKDDEENKDIILKSIKSTFKPEFINRIDNICYFNRLTDDDIRRIIINEVGYVRDKVVNIGYELDDDILHGALIDSIFDVVKSESEYGARPILREIQKQLEDKLTDCIIDDKFPLGYKFTYNDIK